MIDVTITTNVEIDGEGASLTEEQLESIKTKNAQLKEELGDFVHDMLNGNTDNGFDRAMKGI